MPVVFLRPQGPPFDNVRMFSFYDPFISLVLFHTTQYYDPPSPSQPPVPIRHRCESRLSGKRFAEGVHVPRSPIPRGTVREVGNVVKVRIGSKTDTSIVSHSRLTTMMTASLFSLATPVISFTSALLLRSRTNAQQSGATST